MKEGLLLDRVALHPSDISPGHIQGAGTVVTNFAHARPTLGYWTTMATRVTADAIAVQLFVKIAFPDLAVNDFSQTGHTCYVYSSLATLDAKWFGWTTRTREL